MGAEKIFVLTGICQPPKKLHTHFVFDILCSGFRQHRTELVVQDAYGQIYLTRQIFRQIV